MRDRLWQWCVFFDVCVVDISQGGSYIVMNRWLVWGGLDGRLDPLKNERECWFESGDGIRPVRGPQSTGTQTEGGLPNLANDFWYLMDLGKVSCVCFFSKMLAKTCFFSVTPPKNGWNLGGIIFRLILVTFTAGGNTPPEHWWVGRRRSFRVIGSTLVGHHFARRWLR